MHPDMWYHLNAISHHDGCRLVHPTKWDISSMSYVIMMDADWCIPPSGTLDNFGVPSWRMLIGASRQAVHSVYRFNSRCQELTDLFTTRFIIHIHLVFKYHISISYSLSYYLFKDILNLCTHFLYSFPILIHILISYTH